MTKERKRKKKRPLYGLHRKAMSKIHREYHDIDYVDKLSPEEKEWLSRFMEETLQSTFLRDGGSHYPDHETERKPLYNESNERRRCVMGMARVGYVAVDKGVYRGAYSLSGIDNEVDSNQWGYKHSKTLGEIINHHPGSNATEDAMLDLIDAKAAGECEGWAGWEPEEILDGVKVQS